MNLSSIKTEARNDEQKVWRYENLVTTAIDTKLSNLVIHHFAIFNFI